MSKVEPIRNMNDVYRMEDKLLQLGTPRGDRMFMMFEVGIFMGLRIGDMLQLRIGDIRHKDSYTFKPQKTDERHRDGELMPGYRAKELTCTISPALRRAV